MWWTGIVTVWGDTAVTTVSAPPGTRTAGTGEGRWLPSLLMVLASMISVQVGLALAVHQFPALGVTGTTWLRLVLAAAVLLAATRPRLRSPDNWAAVALGVVTAVSAVTFASATARIPLGTAVAIEFCGPLSVAAVGGSARGIRRLVWPSVALTGVLLLTRPWAVAATESARAWAGLGFAVLAAAAWAGYILLTQHVGLRSDGLSGAAIALATAAVAVAPVGVGQAWPPVHAALTGSDHALIALAGCGLAALLVPLAALVLEMNALRRMDKAEFGVWMAGEPALGVVLGALLLGQYPFAWQLPGFALVVLAGIATHRCTSTPLPDGPGPVQALLCNRTGKVFVGSPSPDESGSSGKTR